MQKVNNAQMNNFDGKTEMLAIGSVIYLSIYKIY